MSQTPYDSVFFRQCLGRFATGVTIVTAQTPDGTVLGLTANSFNAVSLDPPLVLWSLSRAASSHDGFLEGTRYVVHVLGAGQTDLALRFARGTIQERFDRIPTTRAPGGALMLDLPMAAWFECTHAAQYPAGDHTILVGAVEHCANTDIPPLVFHAGGFDLTPAQADSGTE